MATVAVAAGVGLLPAAAATGGVRSQPAGTISTFAGGVGGPGKATKVALTPCDVISAGGALYAGTGSEVRKVSSSGLLTTPAGDGAGRPLGERGLAVRASLNGACGVALDRSGNLLIVDDNRLRAVPAVTGTFYGRAMQARHIYVLAGDGTSGLGDGGPALQATLASPEGVAVDGAGNVVIADSQHNRVRVVAAVTGTFYSQAMTAGDIYTVAGGGTSGLGDGGPATSAQLSTPWEVAVDGAGNLVIADSQDNRVRVVAKSTGTFYGRAMTAGNIYTVAGDGTGGFSGDGGPATSAELSDPRGVAVDRAGNLVIADSGNNRVRVVADRSGRFYGRMMTAGDIYTVAGTGTAGFSGDGGRATSAEVSSPEGVAVDGVGNLVIADNANGRLRVVAASTARFYGRAMTAGDIYTVAGTGTAGFSGDRGPASHAELSSPEGVAVDGAGNVVIADTHDNRVRVVAAGTGTFYGRAMTAGDIYTVAGTGTAGFSGDGGPATHAELHAPQRVGLDGAGNLVIADTGNNRVRVVTTRSGTFYGRAMTAGDIYTVAGDGTQGFSGDGGPGTSAELSLPAGVAVDGAGNLLIADWGNYRVRVVAAGSGTFYGQAMTAGDIYTVAGDGSNGFSGDGGPAVSAGLAVTSGVAVDGAGNVLIADTDDDRLRVVAASTGTFYGQVMTAGDIYTLAGGNRRGFKGDGGPATRAELSFPGDVAVDGAGNLVIADGGNRRVRVIAVKPGSFYGQAMTAGDIYTVAGMHQPGFAGDGGPGTRARLDGLNTVAVDAGNLVIADTSNNRVREVAG